MSQTQVIVLAAGLGSRMRSQTIKVLHEVAGRPMVLRVLDAVFEAGLGSPLVVLGYQAEQVRARLPEQTRVVLQANPVGGTGDAVAAALAEVPAEASQILVLLGDTPLIQGDVLRTMLATHEEQQAAITVLSMIPPEAAGYGRIVRQQGRLVRIVEERDATAEERAISEVNSGISVFSHAILEQYLPKLSAQTAQGQKYLTEVIELAVQDGHKVFCTVAPQAADVMGIDDRMRLAQAEARLRQRTLQRLMISGVTVVDPSTTYVHPEVQIGTDTVLKPNTHLEGACRIGAGCVVGPGSLIIDSVLEDRATVVQSVVEQSYVGEGSRVGPFAHLRSGSRLGPQVEIGNFAEVKNATLGEGTKSHHHSYLGDADLGRHVNVGAGVITVNYDGRRKHRTKVADRAFLGCNVNLVAPVEVGEHAFVAAGSTITENVESEALAIARQRQTTLPGWAARRDHRDRKNASHEGEGS